MPPGLRRCDPGGVAQSRHTCLASSDGTNAFPSGSDGSGGPAGSGGGPGDSLRRPLREGSSQQTDPESVVETDALPEPFCLIESRDSVKVGALAAHSAKHPQAKSHWSHTF